MTAIRASHTAARVDQARPGRVRRRADRARYGAGTVTFVDDRPENVVAAVGMRALLFTDPATLAADLRVGPAR
ncbi:MAG TPA: hypothetical protein VF734_02875 [Pseudonocardiaceae bacterium]